MRILAHSERANYSNVAGNFESAEFSDTDLRHAQQIISQIQLAEGVSIDELGKRQIGDYLTSLADVIDELTNEELLAAGFEAEEGTAILEQLRRNYQEDQYPSSLDPSATNRRERKSQRLVMRSDNREIIAVATIKARINNPTLLEITNDQLFLAKLDKVCRLLTQRFRVSQVYSWEDLRQDVLIQFGQTFANYQGESSYESVIYRIAYNRLIDLHMQPRKVAVSFDELELDEDEVKASSDEFEKVIETSMLFRDLLNSLDSSGDRTLFVEHFMEGKSRSEIAQRHGISTQAVSKRLARLTRKLKQYV